MITVTYFYVDMIEFLFSITFNIININIPKLIQQFQKLNIEMNIIVSILMLIFSYLQIEIDKQFFVSIL